MVKVQGMLGKYRPLIYRIRTDSLFQFRSGLHGIYIIIAMIYAILLSLLNHGLKEQVGLLLIYSDPAVLGFFFVGGLFMLEKQAGVLAALLVTPMKIYTYLLGKVITLGILGATISAGIAVLSEMDVTWWILFIVVCMLSGFFTLLGIRVALSCRTLNQYFGKVVPVCLFILLPCIGVLRFDFWQVLLVFPGMSSLNSLYYVFYGGSLIEFVISVASLLGWSLWMLADLKKVFITKLIEEGGAFHE